MDDIVDNLNIAVLGLGEAGVAIAADLVEAGAAVGGWDPVTAPDIPGLRLAADAGEALAGATLVLSLNRAEVALALAAEVAPSLVPGAVFADLNTAAPALKRELAAVTEAAGARFADVGLLGPVPGNGLATPSLASGSGAEAYAAALTPLGAAVEVLGPLAGEAAERKLLRSVFAKGMATAAVEALAAARAAGCEEWLHGQLVSTLSGADAALVERWLRGSRLHAARRVDEMRASGEMLAALGTPARIVAAAGGWFEQLAQEGLDAPR